MDFIYDANPSRVIFAAGARSTTGEETRPTWRLADHGHHDPPQAQIAAEFARLIGARAGIVYPGAQVNNADNVTEAALTAVFFRQG